MKKITNKYIAQILYQIADILEMKDELVFKIRAYQRAAREIEEYPESVSSIKDMKKLEEIPGIGEGIAKKIIEISETGTCNYYEQLKKMISADIVNLIQLEGVGPKTIKRLYDELGVKNIKDLEKAAKEGRIQKLEGFKEKTERNILKSIQSFRKRSTRFRLDQALGYADIVLSKLKKQPETEKIDIAGSIRRRKETIGDMDVLISSKNPVKSMEHFTTLPEVERVLGKGDTKSTVEFENGFQADLRVIDKKSWGAAMQYFTGDKSHNVKVRQIAIKKGYKLNEYGLFNKKGRSIAGKTEDEIYKKLGMVTPPAEIRRDIGEIEAAQKGKLPKLIELKDIRGDLQMHTTFSDGVNSPKEMADEAVKLGYEYIAITEHNTEGLEVAGGVKSSDIPKYIRSIRSIKSQIKVMAGMEVNIDKDGSLTVPDKYLKMLDIVLVAIHSNFRMDKDAMTKRIIKAVSNPYVNILAHPTGRLLLKRDGYEFDFEAVCKACKKNDVCLEINAYPDRLDLNGDQARLAKELSCTLSIGTDSHSAIQLSNLKYGVFMARRGWLEKNDVINSFSYKKLVTFLKK